MSLFYIFGPNINDLDYDYYLLFIITPNYTAIIPKTRTVTCRTSKCNTDLVLYLKYEPFWYQYQRSSVNFFL